MTNRLKIEFRKKQFFLNNDPLHPVLVICNVDGTATYIPGIIDPNPWVEVTDDTEGLDGFSLSWQAITEDFGTGDNTGEANQFGSNYSKGLSGDLRFFKTAFQFVFDWLMTDPCQILNAVEVKVTDMNCNKDFRLFELKLENTKYAPFDEPCIVGVPLREHDDIWHSFQKTIIEDNWQNWFNQDGGSSKSHPTFPFIVEKKPKFILAISVVLIYIAGMLSTGLLLSIPGGIEWINRTLGFWYFAPSPLIRTYIQNICAKFGYTFSTMFDDDPSNPYRDVCVFYPVSTSLKNFLLGIAPSTKFIWDNRTVYSFATFLNQLKKVFNAEWYITPNNKLVFQPKSFFDNQVPIYDFTAPGADRYYKFEYTFNGNKKPAYGDYQYQIDPQDTCSNEVKWRYNSIVDFDGPANNPMLEGHITKDFDFAATAFHRDGSSDDFLEEGIRTGRTVAILAIIVGLGELFLSSNFITVALVVALLTLGYTTINNYMNDFFNDAQLNGIVRVASSEINVPRLLLWDRDSALNYSKVVQQVAPVANPYYNAAMDNYFIKHPTYDDPGYFGTEVTTLYNYPMVIDEDFFGNLYDRFHEYDNPLKNPIINQDFEFYLDLCCDWMDRLGTWNGDYAKIGATLILENRNGRLIKGRITNIEVKYKSGEIYIKGNVLK